MIRTNFQTLERGMTKTQFLATWQKNTEAAIGSTPSQSQSFRLDEDIWEVWIYDIYNEPAVLRGYAYLDHHEYVAFKNDLLEKWGIGTLPITLRANPNRVDVHIHQ